MEVCVLLQERGLCRSDCSFRVCTEQVGDDSLQPSEFVMLNEMVLGMSPKANSVF